MKNVTSLLGKGIGTLTLASVVFMLPANGEEALAATPYESWGGELINVEAQVGDGCVSFTWEWDEFRLEEGQTELPVWISTVDMNRLNEDGWAVDETDYAVMGENVWIVKVPVDVNGYTFSDLVNGTTYWFDCYADFTNYYAGGDEYYVPLVPESSSEGGSTTTPENPSEDGSTTTPENPSEDGSTTTPENPSEDGSTTTPENPSEDGSTTTPENPSEGGGTTGTTSSSASKEKSGVEVFAESLSAISDSIDKAEAGETIKIEGGDGFHALPNSVMKALYEKGDVSLEFSYDYEGVDYTIVIPAGKAVNNDIPWYGPMYLATYFGK